MQVSIAALTGQVDTNVVIGIGALVLTLWVASIGAAWKVATILSKVTGELQSMREQTERNAANIAAIQRRFNIPQAEQ